MQFNFSRDFVRVESAENRRKREIGIQRQENNPVAGVADGEKDEFLENPAKKILDVPN